MKRIAGFALWLFAAVFAAAQNTSLITGEWTVTGPVLLNRLILRFFTPPNNISESSIPRSELRVRWI